MNAEQSFDFYIKSTWLAISKMYNQIAATHNSTQAHGFVLISIDKEEGTPSTKIAPLLGMEPTGLSRILKTLEEQGFIYRQKDDHDKRIIRIFLTEKGLEKRKIAVSAVKGFNEHLMNCISQKHFEIFKQIMDVAGQCVEDYKSKKLAEIQSNEQNN